MRKKKTNILNIFFTVFVIVAFLLIGKWTVNLVSAEAEIYQDLKVFTELIKIIKENYVDEVDIKDLVYGAASGMVNSLDPHSSFLPPDLYKEVQIDTKGEFGGLGIQIGIKDGILTVIAPIEDTPAYRAGIKAGDKIVKVEGESTKKMTLFEAVRKMRGPRNTDVTITVYRESWKQTKDFTITRDIITVKSIKNRIIDDNIGYIKILQFQEKTVDDLDGVIEELMEKEIKALILDLRNNPGGLLQSAVGVTDKFLPDDKLVVYIKGRTGQKQEFLTRNGDMTNEIPIVVLINQGSASASEIVSGALKDWQRAILVGNSTFGKGSVQTIVPLQDGSGLRLTTARYYTPKGVSIQNTGITPDIVVKIEAPPEKSLLVVREKDLEGHLDNDQMKEDSEDKRKEGKESFVYDIDEKGDTQLQRAIDILKTWDILNKEM